MIANRCGGMDDRPDDDTLPPQIRRWAVWTWEREEWIAHRDFTPIAAVSDDALLEYARAHRVAAD